MANNLPKYWSLPVSRLARPIRTQVSPEWKERHGIYAQLLMAINTWYFNPFKFGPEWEYPFAPAIVSYWSRKSYQGHNIAALAVDGHGHIIDFALNQNELYQSSIEHAEARLLRRVFALCEIHHSWHMHSAEGANYSNLLSNVTVYTTLESCTQCTGIMTLAGVKEVIYLQTDPQMYNIGFIVRRLSRVASGAAYLQAPLPVAGSSLGLTAFSRLNDYFRRYRQLQARRVTPFALRHGPPYQEKFEPDSITSFLCTREAYSVFEAAGKELVARTSGQLNFPGFRPLPDRHVLTNLGALREAKQFIKYVHQRRDRATAHKT